jgi:uncharacterized membrane protein
LRTTFFLSFISFISRAINQQHDAFLPTKDNIIMDFLVLLSMNKRRSRWKQKRVHCKVENNLQRTKKNILGMLIRIH